MTRKVLFVLTFFSHVLSAQTQDFNSSQINDLMLRQLDENARLGKDTYAGIDGTPFLDETFIKGKVITSRGEFKNVNMRYNVFEDAMEFDTGNQRLLLDANPIIEEINLDNRKFVVRVFKDKSREILGFLIELEAGTIDFYTKKNVSYREAEPAGALESEPTPPKYVKLSDTYYIRIGEDELLKVSNAKNIISLFPDHAGELKKYQKSEKLANKKEKDLIQLVKFANTLF